MKTPRVKKELLEAEQLFEKLNRVEECAKRLEEIRVDVHKELQELGVPIAQFSHGMLVN